MFQLFAVLACGYMGWRQEPLAKALIVAILISAIGCIIFTAFRFNSLAPLNNSAFALPLSLSFFVPCALSYALTYFVKSRR